MRIAMGGDHADLPSSSSSSPSWNSRDIRLWTVAAIHPNALVSRSIL